jgi:hypothetical protein
MVLQVTEGERGTILQRSVSLETKSPKVLPAIEAKRVTILPRLTSFKIAKSAFFKTVHIGLCFCGSATNYLSLMQNNIGLR